MGTGRMVRMHTSSARMPVPSIAVCTNWQVRSAVWAGDRRIARARAAKPSAMSRRRSSISPSVYSRSLAPGARLALPAV